MGYENLFIYEGGVFKWAKQFPDKTIFHGKLLSTFDLKEIEISREKYCSKCLSVGDFIKHAKNGKYRIIDTRDLEERDKFPIILPGLFHFPMDRVEKLLKSKSRKLFRHKLLIFDNSGNQVLWLQYVLEQSGHPHYFFLEGGVSRWRINKYDKYGNK
jgi:hypothetical protein